MATAKIIRYKQKTLKDGSCPIALQVIFERQPKRFFLGGEYKCFDEQWNDNAREFTKKFKDYKEKNKVLRSTEANANAIIDDFIKTGKPFNLTEFEERYKGLNKIVPTVFEFFETRINEMKAQNHLANSVVYDSDRRVLGKFHPNKNLAFTDIDYKFLTRYEGFLKERGNNGGGIANHMRTLRALINEAIKRGYFSKELYPYRDKFNSNGYTFSHIKSDARPRALSEKDMQKIKDFPLTEYPDLNFGYKIFMFTYYSRGMNITDIAKLKKSNLYNNRINYTRTKTEKPLSVLLSKPLTDIIKEFENPNSDYLFPILNETYQTAQEIKTRIANMTKQVNERLKKIAKILEINVNLTTYVSRHTYATTLKRKGVGISKISELLGHSEESTTTAYLKKFEDSELDESDSLL